MASWFASTSPVLPRLGLLAFIEPAHRRVSCPCRPGAVSENLVDANATLVSRRRWMSWRKRIHASGPKRSMCLRPATSGQVEPCARSRSYALVRGLRDVPRTVLSGRPLPTLQRRRMSNRMTTCLHGNCAAVHGQISEPLLCAGTQSAAAAAVQVPGPRSQVPLPGPSPHASPWADVPCRPGPLADLAYQSGPSGSR